MGAKISFIDDARQWRVIGNWSATEKGEPTQGVINYGFSSCEDAVGYLNTLTRIAVGNNFDVRSEFGLLCVNAKVWGSMTDFQGTYRVASYITNN